MKEKRSYPAVFTLEATMVMAVVFMMLSAMIRYGCVLHDEVTGSMILEEAMEKARYQSDETLRDALNCAEEEGTEMGDPRIWLGKYAIEIKSGLGILAGEAVAGDWKKEIWLPRIRPGEFLREYEIMNELDEGTKKDGS